MEKRDKNGLTERKFLESYSSDKYKKPSLTADIVLIARDGDKNELLLIKRGGHPYIDCFALPGGFAEPEESIERTAARELYEETAVENVVFESIGVFSSPGRDPRGWVVSDAFLAVADKKDIRVLAGDDAAKAVWFSVLVNSNGKNIRLVSDGEEINIKFEKKNVPSPFGVRAEYHITDDGGLAFDHALILATAMGKLGLI
mgnify:FL=1